MKTPGSLNPSGKTGANSCVTKSASRGCKPTRRVSGSAKSRVANWCNITHNVSSTRQTKTSRSMSHSSSCVGNRRNTAANASTKTTRKTRMAAKATGNICSRFKTGAHAAI
jgi:hypothetical protein